MGNNTSSNAGNVESTPTEKSPTQAENTTCDSPVGKATSTPAAEKETASLSPGEPSQTANEPSLSSGKSIVTDFSTCTKYVYEDADETDYKETDDPVGYHDCKYFFSRNPCPQGMSCTFRHEPKALISKKPEVCRYWENGSCSRKVCTYRHDYLEKESSHAVWLWQDNDGLMIPYGNKHPAVTGRRSTVVSADIEREYNNTNRTGVFAFNVDGNSPYILYFSAMVQESMRTRRNRKVERRIQYPRPGRRSGMPASWQDMPMGAEWTTVKLDLSSKEYKRVQEAFQFTLPNAKVIHIKRVQNVTAWRAHEDFRRKQELLLGCKVHNLLLFHGTQYQSVDDICLNNFDINLAGNRFGSSYYGKGIYFARYSSYSDKFCTVGPTTVLKKIFACKVLVGHMARGHQIMTEPPLDPKSEMPCDTTVDNVVNPSIFVKYDKDSFYPAYVIEYV